MRQRTPALLVVVCAGILVSGAAGSLPPQSHSNKIPSLAVDLGADAMHSPQSLDPHPFATEFYLRQFASDANPPEVRQQRSSWLSPMFAPVTNAASGLSKKMASLRRALVRMMP